MSLKTPVFFYEKALFFLYFRLYTTDSAISSAVFSPRSCPIRLSAKSTAVPRPRLVVTLPSMTTLSSERSAPFNPSMQDGYAVSFSALKKSQCGKYGRCCTDGCDLFALFIKICQEVTERLIFSKIFCARHATRDYKHVRIRKIGFFKNKVCLHMDSVRSGDVPDVLNRNCLYIDLCAAPQVDYQSVLQCLQIHRQKNIYFFVIKTSSLIDILALMPARCFIAILSFSIAFHVQKGYTKSENIIIYQGVLLWKSKENI